MFDALTTEAEQILKRSFQITSPIVSWQLPREAERGDIATSVALSSAKSVKRNPLDIAKVLAEGLGSLADVERAEAVVPGYVNVWLQPSVLLRELSLSREAHVAEVKKRAKRQPVIVEYSQPNIAKPLGIHHILSTVIGQSLANLHRQEGFSVVAINHIGDWGTQFGKLAVAMRRWGKGKSASALGLDGLLELYVKFHEEAAKQQELEDEARAAFKMLEDGDAAMRAFWEEVVAVTMKALGSVYERLHVSFDAVIGESFYEDKMQTIIEEGKGKGVFVEGEQRALIVEYPEETKLPPFMILKSDGATLYSTRDLATIRYRMDQWKPSEILYVVDVAQSLHFRQLFETVRLLGWEAPQLEHVVFGRMRFKEASMSTRKGTVLKLEDVLDEAVKRAKAVIEEHKDTIQTDDKDALAEMMGVGALVYGILSQGRTMDIVFDWAKMLSFEGNSAPYLQYTHARARSVLRKAETEGVDLPGEVASLTDAERLLLKTLLLFPSVIADARESRMPHKLANYLYQLASDFNAFYNVEPILKAEGSARAFRLALTTAAASTLRAGAELLTLRVPDRM